MSRRQRDRVLGAIRLGYDSPTKIGQYLNKSPILVSKLLYLLKTERLIEHVRHGKYQIAAGYVDVTARIPVELNARLNALRTLRDDQRDDDVLLDIIKIGIAKMERQRQRKDKVKTT